MRWASGVLLDDTSSLLLTRPLSRNVRYSKDRKRTKYLIKRNKTLPRKILFSNDINSEEIRNSNYYQTEFT